MTKYLLSLVFLPFFILLSQKGYATHAMGGDIWYECNGGNNYTIFFAFYRDCDGVNAPNTLTIDYSSSCTGTNQIVLTQLAGTGQDITPTCPSQQSTCDGGNFPGVEKYVYSANVNLAPCADWVFSTSICCRNNAITNITAPGGESMYLQATLDNLNNNCNSSPSFTSDPVPYVCVGETFCFNHGAIDADGDSIAFSLAVPFDQGPTDPVNYLGGFNANQPVSSNPQITFDPLTGDICMTPSAIEVSVTAVVVEHWSNGQLVGTVMRDIQIIAINCNNILPTIDGIDATNNFTTSACAGTPINFTTNSNDGNAGNLLTMSWNSGIPNATFNIANNGTTNPVGSFSWTPTLADVSNTPYCFTVTIQDDQCPLNGFQIYSFCITVGAGTVMANVVGSDPSCNGVCDGEVTVTGSGGLAPYTYSIDGTTYNTATSFTGLCAGSYDLYAMDDNGCASSSNINLFEPLPIVLTTAFTPPSCNGENNGIANVTVAGGTAPYSYNWSNGNLSAVNSGITAGSYDVTVTDANGCSEIATVVVTEPPLLTVASAVTDPSCVGNDGEISLTATGGTGTYIYSWSHNGALNNASASNLTANTYNITITDANLCEAYITEIINVVGTADASFSFNGNQCINTNNYNFTNLGSFGAGVSHEWGFGDAVGTSTAENPIYTYTTPGTYNVEHVVVSGVCSDTIVQTVIVYDIPVITTNSSDVLCFGGANGAIDLTVTGGNPNYGYSWDNGVIFQDLNNISAGQYSVVVSDNNGCLAYDTIVIAEPDQLIVSSTVNLATCDGVCDGSSITNVSGGVQPYTYSWNDASNQSVPNATNLCAGNYIVEVEDVNGCVETNNITIIDADTVNVTIDVTPSSCGQPDGELTANPSGGTPIYSYSWSPIVQNTQTATSLPAGNYTVTVTDANGCTAINSDLISDIPAPVASISSSTNVLCNGDSTGNATVLATGGTGIYTYSWLPYGGTSSTATNLVAGFYTCTVTDDAGCSTQTSVMITEPTALSLTLGAVNANCGLSDGIVTALVTGGNNTTGYQYQWFEGLFFIGATSSLAVDSGSYYIEVVDDNLCEISDSVTVGDNPAGTLTTLSVDEQCFGACNGSGIVAVSGGNAPFQYQWNDPNQTFGPNVVNLCSGSYIVTVTDDLGCVVQDSILISTPSKLLANVVSETDVTCFGFTDGAAEIVATGGTPPYQYQWDVNAGGQNTVTALGLAPGSYTAVVTDANGCNAFVTVTIEEPSEIILTSTTLSAHCNSADGEAIVNIASGGVSPFSFDWTGSLSTNNTASNVSPGNYGVVVTDSNGCEGLTNITVGNVPAGIATITNPSNPTCFNTCNGIASVSMSGTGTSPYTYAWDTPVPQSGVFATGLCGSINYTVTVTDANGCVSNASISLVDPPALQVDLTPNDAICNGECTGTMQSNVTGGTPPYQYLWNDPAQQVTQLAVNLCAATSYTLTVTDANNCVTSNVNSVGEPSIIQIDSTVLDAFCGQSNGEACINISGGIPGYEVLWIHNGSNTLCQTNMSAGTYLIEVTDINDCPADGVVTVSDISGPTSIVSNVVDVNCAGGNNGQSTIVVTGGTGPFSYEWDANTGNQISPTASNLNAGSYTYSVLDSAGCSTSGVTVITEPDPLTVSTFGTDPICYLSTDGNINTTVFGGTSPYTFSWSHNASLNSANASGLAAGVYSVTVTDANGCTNTNVVNLVNPLPITTSTSVTNLGCNGTCTGTILANPVNGQLPYSYAWNDVNLQSTQMASNLCAGTFEVVITDINGCQDTVSAIVSQPDSLLGSVSLSGNVSCNGACDGYVEAAATGGTSPYSYLWTNGESTQLIEDLCPGNYGAIITDANGCTVSLLQTVTQPNALNGSMVLTNASCYQSCNGNAQFVVSGGTGPYVYQWSDDNFQTTPTASNLCSGAYTVNVTDQNNCVLVGNVSVTEPNEILLQTNITNSNCGQSNGMACVSVSGGVGPYIFQWNDPNSQSTACALGIPSGSYLVDVIDASNCLVSEQINVTDLSGPIITVSSVVDASCNGSNDGAVEMFVGGGTTPYQNYEWIDIATGNTVGTPNSPLLSNQGAGCYSLEITDDVGCSASQNVCIDEPQSLNASFINTSDVSCFGTCDGSTTATFSGGTAPYVYSWSNGESTATASNLCEGIYSITVTDANGCTLVSNATISEPSPLTTVQVGISSTQCSNTCDGSVQIQSFGGTAPYNYFWSPGGANSNTATGLCAGNYTVQTTDANGCQINTNYAVTSPAVLTGTITSVTTTCGECNGTASLVGSGGTLPYNYQWPNGQINSTAIDLCQGSIDGIITDANGCQLTLTTNVPNIPGPSITGFNSTDLLCNNDNSGESTVQFSGGTAPLNFNWSSSGQTTSTLNAASAGTHCVQITDANGCIAFDCTELNEPNVLTGVPDQDATICYGDSAQLWASATGGTGPYVFDWLAPDNNLSGVGPFFVTSDTTHSYCFNVVDANGCAASNTSCIEITVAPPLAITVNGALGICLGDSINLFSTPSGGNGLPYSFEWFYTDTSSASISDDQDLIDYIGSPGTYIITLNDGCSEEAIDSAIVIQEPFPVGDITMSDTAVCFPNEIQFMVTSDIGESYQWDFDSDDEIDFISTDTNAVFTFPAPGSYDVSVTISSAIGCEVTIADSAAATVFSTPTADFTTYPTTVSILIPEVFVLDESNSAESWYWDFTADNVIDDTLQNTSYTYGDLGEFTIMLAIADSNGCVDTVYKSIEVEEDYQIYVPNTFTPDNDGINDYFFAEGTEGALEFRMEVYDRWGLLLWEGHRMSAQWDGTYLGEPVQMDTYVWKVEVLFPNDLEQRVYIGHVNVLK